MTLYLPPFYGETTPAPDQRGGVGVDDRLMRQPRLLVPQSIPVGPVRYDENVLSRYGLKPVFGYVGTQPPVDFVQGYALGTDANWTVQRDGPYLRLTCTAGSGTLNWPTNGLSNRTYQSPYTFIAHMRFGPTSIRSQEVRIASSGGSVNQIYCAYAATQVNGRYGLHTYASETNAAYRTYKPFTVVNSNKTTNFADWAVGWNGGLPASKTSGSLVNLGTIINIAFAAGSAPNTAFDIGFLGLFDGGLNEAQAVELSGNPFMLVRSA